MNINLADTELKNLLTIGAPYNPLLGNDMVASTLPNHTRFIHVSHLSTRPIKEIFVERSGPDYFVYCSKELVPENAPPPPEKCFSVDELAELSGNDDLKNVAAAKKLGHPDQMPHVMGPFQYAAAIDAVNALALLNYSLELKNNARELMQHLKP